MRTLRLLALSFACLAGAPVPAGAAGTAEPVITIDLNRLEAAENACRIFLVFENKTAHAFTALKLDLVMFGPDGVIAKRLAVESAPLRAGKTSLKVFDVEGLPCEGGRSTCRRWRVFTADDSADSGHTFPLE